MVAMEPDPRLFALLAANAAANGLARVAAVQAAAAERDGPLTLSGHAEEGGNWGVSSAEASSTTTSSWSETLCAASAPSSRASRSRRFLVHTTTATDGIGA